MSSAGAPGKSFTIGAGVPSSLTEIITLGRTLKRRSRDILAYFDHPHTSNGTTAATNGRLEHLRGSPNYEEPLYVLDEPLAGVDPLARDYLLELIRTLRSPEAPLLLSTHLINGVDSIFNEIVLISDGRLLTHDSADNLRALGDGDLELAYKRSVSGR